MTNFCLECGSDSVVKKGIVENSEGEQKQRVSCKACGANSYLPIIDDADEPKEKQGRLFKLQEEDKKQLESKNIFVITCSQNDTPVDVDFFNSLKTYCNHRKAELCIIPTRYKNPSAMRMTDDYTWPSVIKPYLLDECLELSDHIKAMGNVHVDATAVNPLSGLHRLSKGKSVVIGHPQIEMTTLPVNKHKHPIVFTTTGTISKKKYSDTKAGIKASYAHNTSALVVEIDRKKDKFHIRHLVAGEDGSFYDLNKHYTPKGVSKTKSIPGIVFGDEHVLFMDEKVKDATFKRKNCLVNVLCPEYLIRHDVIDCYTVSHHHKKDKFLQFAKFINNMNNFEDELRLTCDHMIETTDSSRKSVMVESNHHNHVTQFLNEANPETQPWNDIIYHELMYRMKKFIRDTGTIANPFKLWFEANYEGYKDRFIWLEDEKPFYIGPWNVSNHGHLGPNGSRGSRESISKVPEPSIIGHSHGPGIKGDCIQVGMKSKRKQDWNPGPSNWAHADAIIHPNNKVQLVFISDGDYCLEDAIT